MPTAAASQQEVGQYTARSLGSGDITVAAAGGDGDTQQQGSGSSGAAAAGSSGSTLAAAGQGGSSRGSRIGGGVFVGRALLGVAGDSQTGLAVTVDVPVEVRVT
jgi:hypothetical protein